MLNRQDSLLSSSSRRETPPPPPPPQNHHAKAVGCMPSIIHLLSKYHKKNKRLTSGRKHEKCGVSTPAKTANKDCVTREGSSASSSSSSAINDEYNNNNYDKRVAVEEQEKAVDTRRFWGSSCDIKVPTIRRPTLGAEMRRQSNHEEGHSQIRRGNGHRQPTLVARLMGLEENQHENNIICRSSSNTSAVQVVAVEAAADESTEEKRKKLLQALEKCNEDLEALKNVIKAIQSAEKSVQPPPPCLVKRVVLVNGIDDDVQGTTWVNKCAEANTPPPPPPPQQQLSPPVRVLHQHSTPTTNSPLIITTSSKPINTTGREAQQRKPTPRKKNPRDAAYDNIHHRTCSFRRTTRKMMDEDDPCGLHGIIIKRDHERSSKAMIQSVEQVCRDIAWGQKREVGRIGLVLQDYICRDLIDDMVRELASYDHYFYSLPFEACKRRLCF